MRKLLAGFATVLFVSACQPPLGLGLPTVRELETGAIARLSAAKSLEVAGSYSELGDLWQVDVQFVRSGARHVAATRNGVQVEAILIGKDGYFRSPQLLVQQLNGDPASRSLAVAAGNAWWKGLVAAAPNLSDFTDGARVKAAFINADLVARHDHVAESGMDTAQLSGPRGDVYIAEAAPHELVRLRMRPGVTVDGINQADLRYSHYGADFKIAAPPSVINFADLSTLPPTYTVLSVDGSGCGSPCVVRAVVKNLGGKTGAKAPSSIRFDLADLVSGSSSGTCTATVVPDVDYNATTAVSCTIEGVNGVGSGAAKVTATPINPGHA
jgi:hypothetical protein